MKISKHNQGFTIIELLVVVGILGVISAIAFPAYTGYIDSACISTARSNANTHRGFQENYMIENNTYLAGSLAAGVASNPWTDALHWDPDDDGRYTYTVVAGSTGNINSSLLITVSAPNCSVDATEGN